MLSVIETINTTVNNFIWGVPAMICIIGVGLYLSIRTGFLQIRKFPYAMKTTVGRMLRKREASDGRMTPFQAVCTALAATVGTGNIAGVAGAIAIGGPGAVFWMWIIAFIGGASAFAESTLAQIYKVKGKEGKFIGGPAYYIEKALNFKVLAVLFCIAMLLTYAFGFNMLASYNLQTTFAIFPFYNADITPWVIGGILAIVAGWCLLGGEKRIVKVTSKIVPTMGIAYVGISILVIILNAGNLPMVFGTIFAEAFNFKAIFAGFGASVLMQGIKRGLYSNEAGIGSAPNAAAAADTSHPAKQGLIQMLSVFIDTLILCTATAMMCMSSGIDPAKELQGAPWVQASLQESLGSFGPVFITVAMVFFAFTTLLGNCFYCDNLLIYIHKKQPGKAFMKGFRLVSALAIFLGAGMEMSLLWDLSDVLMGVMALINIPVILILSEIAFKAVQDYEAQLKKGINPVFKSADIGLSQKTDFWS